MFIDGIKIGFRSVAEHARLLPEDMVGRAEFREAVVQLLSNLREVTNAGSNSLGR